MISVITGLHGAGKTWFMVNKFLYPHWLAGGHILAYNQLLFSPDNERIIRFYQLSDLYGASEAMIGFPEIQKLLNADSWRSMPAPFRDLLSEHRHSRLNIVGDTQNIMLIDINLRHLLSQSGLVKLLSQTLLHQRWPLALNIRQQLPMVAIL